MTHRPSIRRAIALICLCFVAGAASQGFAQDVSKANRSQAVSKTTKDAASKRAEELSKRLDKDKETGEVPDKNPQVTLEQFQDQQQTLSPEQIDQLKRQLEQKNRTMIAKLDRIIEGDPYNAQKPEWMFQKAELMWELRNWEYLRKRAEYNQCVTAAGQGTSGDKCAEPDPNYKEPQEIYKAILTEYPDYGRLDEVIYRLGSGLIEAGEGPQAVSYLQRLVKNYPNSKYLPDAKLALAEFFFEKEMLQVARDNYQGVLEYKNNSNYDYALYKLGWVFYNMGEYRKSIDTFKAVVERTDDKLGFQNQAINDLVVAYAEVDDGWKEVREYFTKMRDIDFTYKKLGQMAGLYEAQGKDDQAVAIYEYFIKERPDHMNIPTWMESVIVAKKKINDFEDLEKTMNRYVAYLDPDGTWAVKNKDNEGSLSNARLLSEASLAFLANTYHRRAQKHDTEDDYRTATGYYEEFIRRFPDSPASFDMNFFVADIYLINLGEYENAAKYYQRVVDLYKDGKTPKGAKKEDIEAIVKDSAYGVVNAYNELVKKNHPDSVLVEMAEFQEKYGDKDFKKDKVDATTESKPNPTVEIPKYEAGFVTASDQYSEMYPDDDITPTIDYVSAEVYKARGHYDKCIPRYENIIEYAPKHRYASYAGASLLVANYVLKRWDEVEKWARHMMENKIFEVTPEEDLKQAIALAINERAKGLKEEGKTENAASELLRLAKEFPKSDLAPGALFNAAAIYEAGEKINEAVEIYERVVQEYPKNLKAPEALFVMGAIYESRADFDRAASYFERLGSTAEYVNAEGDEVEYKDHESAGDAVYNAAVLREAMEQWDKSIATYEKYMKLWPDRDNVSDVRLRLAFLEKERENWKAAYDRFGDYFNSDDAKPAEKVEIQAEMGLLVEKTKPRKWEEKADEHFTKTVKLWSELEKEEDKKKTRFFAGQARFRQAEAVYNDFTQIKLGFPMSKLEKSLKDKGELQQKAEKMYFEVIDMQSPRWVAAASFRIGQMYKNFSDEIYNLPMPEGLTPEQEDAYRFQLDEYAFPLQEKALKAYRTALQLALKFEAYNEWSSKSAEAISNLESEAYPITQQEGVSTEHDRLNFFIPAPITGFGDGLVERIKSRRPKPAPAPAPTKGGDGNTPAKPQAAR